MPNEFKIISINISNKKGEKKTPVNKAELEQNHGIIGDAHADGTHRQISLLAEESIAIIKNQGIDVNPGDFAENITTQGVVLHELPIGTKLKIGTKIELEVTQIGKECHDRCAIYAQVGDCVMPKQGIFARILQGGILEIGDKGIVISNNG